MSNKPLWSSQMAKLSGKPKLKKKRDYHKNDEVPSFLFDGIPTSLLSADLSNSLHRSLQTENSGSPYPLIEKKGATPVSKTKKKERLNSPSLKVNTIIDDPSHLAGSTTPNKIHNSRRNPERHEPTRDVSPQPLHASTPNNQVRTNANSDSLRRQPVHSQSKSFGYLTPSRVKQKPSPHAGDSSLQSDFHLSNTSYDDTADYHSANLSLTNQKQSSDVSNFSYERTNHSNMEYMLQTPGGFDNDPAADQYRRANDSSNMDNNKQPQEVIENFEVPKQLFDTISPLQTTSNIPDYYASPHLYNRESSHSHNSSVNSSSSLTNKNISRSRMVNSPHSRQSSLSWPVNLPEEWTLERVVYWLNLYGFNKSWTDVFSQNGLSGDKFLSLANYNNLSKYIDHLDFTADSTPSRFIHLLRKTIDKPNSDATARLVSPSFDMYTSRNSIAEMGDNDLKDDQSIVSISDSGSVTPSPLQSRGIMQLDSADPQKDDASYLPDLAPTFSAPNLSTINKKSHMAKSSQESIHSMQPKQVKKLSSRPFSSIESTSSNFALPPSPASFSHGFFKRHTKSNSSESSIFNTLFNGSTSYNPDSDSHSLSTKTSKLDSPTDSRKGFINILRNKVNVRAKSVDLRAKSSRQIGSPVSTLSSPTDTSSLSKIREYETLKTFARGSEPKLEPSPVDEERSLDQMGLFNFVLERKYHPVSKKSNSDLFILITKDNKSFRPCNIGSISDLNLFKLKILEELGFPAAENLAFHLTDFGSDEGERLTDSLLEKLRSFAFYGGTSKLLVYDSSRERRDSVSNELSLYPSSTSSSLAQSIEISETNTYPATPQYLLGVSALKDPVDYMNFKESYAQSRRKSSAKQLPGLTPMVPELTESSEQSSAGTIKLNSAKFDGLTSTMSSNSFRLIRKDSGGEIDFDKRRESPFQKSQIVAKRNPPPPPSTTSLDGINRSTSSLMRNRSLLKKPTIPPPPPPVAPQGEDQIHSKVDMRPTSEEENSYLSPFTPGLSTTLVPQPYRGGLSPVSRTPVSPIDPEYGSEGLPISRVKTSSSPQHEQVNSYPHMRRDDSMKSFRSILDKNKFKENFISFEGAPALSDNESDTGDSDDDLWAKAPAKTASTEAIEKPETFLLGNEIPPKMTVRPPAEVVYDNLERFFPNTDLDKPIVDDVSSPMMSPLAETAPTKNSSPSPVPSVEKEPEKRPKSISRKVSSAEDDRLKVPEKGNITGRHQRMKTIRVVAREANEARKRLSQSANNNKKNNLLRRTSTKMWGQKVVEVTPSQIKGGYVSKLKNHNGEYKQFAWVKGQLIGKGTFGKVYLALNVTTGEMMAVKQVKVPRSGKANQQVTEVIDALLSEVETMKDLDHENIVQYLGFERVENIYSLFLEYVAGGSVGSCLRMYGRFEEDLIRFLSAQVLQGLAYLHSRGILHRDLKADNLLLEIDGVCKISDFGISKRSQNIYANDAEMSMQGTIFWMAPEVIDNVVHNKKQGYSAKIDIWSLGCVVLEMFAGRRPWSNVEAIGAIYKLGKTKLAPPIPEDTLPYVSKEGKDFIERCFTIDPEKRPTAEELLKHPFCKMNPKFDFKMTKLARLIKFNEKSKEEILRLEAKEGRSSSKR